MLIRPERNGDQAAIRELNAATFASTAEARLVDRLRREADPCVSLVAEVDGKVAGHIMFTPVSLPHHPQLRMMGLAPMAVAPALQRRGIGSALVRSGLERCKQMGCAVVVVLGHPAYYPRFGFRSGAEYGLGCAYDVPAEAFMVMELQAGHLTEKSGTISYHAAFADL